MRPRRPFSSLRDCRIGLPTSCDSVRASVSCVATTRSRNSAIAASRFPIGTRRPARLRRRARASYFARTALALSAATSAMTAPVAGLVIFIVAPWRIRTQHRAYAR